MITGGSGVETMLASHSEVDKVSFAGSTEVGQDLRRLTAGSGKKLSLGQSISLLRTGGLVKRE